MQEKQNRQSNYDHRPLIKEYGYRCNISDIYTSWKNITGIVNDNNT